MKVKSISFVISLMTALTGVQSASKSIPTSTKTVPSPFTTTLVNRASKTTPEMTTYSYVSSSTTYSQAVPVPTDATKMVLDCGEKHMHDFEILTHRYCVSDTSVDEVKHVDDSSTINQHYDCFELYKNVDLIYESSRVKKSKSCQVYTQNSDPVKTYSYKGSCKGFHEKRLCSNYIYTVREKISDSTITSTKTVPTVPTPPFTTITSVKIRTPKSIPSSTPIYNTKTILTSTKNVSPISTITVSKSSKTIPKDTIFSYVSSSTTYTQAVPIPTNAIDMILDCGERRKDEFENSTDRLCDLSGDFGEVKDVDESLTMDVHHYCYDLYKNVDLTYESDEVKKSKSCKVYTQNTDPVTTYSYKGTCKYFHAVRTCYNDIYTVRKTVSDSTITSTKTIPNTASTSTTTVIVSTKTVPTKTVPSSSTTITSTKIVPVTDCNVTVTVTEKERTTITVKETVTVYSENVSQETETCAKKWEQCGGTNFNGPTCCESGSTCHEYSKQYSQCI